MAAAVTAEENTDANDSQTTETRHLNQTFRFAKVESKWQWRRYAAELRLRVLMSAGLYPPPVKTPLRARVFDRIERDGYSVEKVYFESLPNFYVTGNLYRPRGQPGPFPAVLNPHGHWQKGRLADEEIGSIPARCIQFARMGMVAFSWDMVGYTDSRQVPHTFAHPNTPEGQRANLWGIHLLGLQLWNSIRALDFVASLPDVDARRIACTGESGGGTQTFLLCAVDERVRVAAPVNMISAHMQGGCLCENAPNLRLDTHNVEIAALFAPKPMLMVSCTGDWTQHTPRREFPAVRRIYELFGAAHRIGCAHVDAPHNYNRQSREAVYGWFAHHLLGRAQSTPLPESSYQREEEAALLVFPDGAMPDGALDADALTEQLIAARAAQLAALTPRNRRGLTRLRQILKPALRHALAAEMPDPKTVTASFHGDDQRLVLQRANRPEKIPAWLLTPNPPSRTATLIVPPEGMGDEPSELARALREAGQTVMMVEVFSTGRTKRARKSDVEFFTTYNRTDTALRVQDILTALAYLQQRHATVNLVGMGEAGLWCLLARGLADGVATTVVDAAQFDNDDDEAFRQRLFVPCLRRAGDLSTAGALTAPHRLWIHNTGGEFRADRIRAAFVAAGAADRLRVEQDEAAPASLVRLLSAPRSSRK